MRRMFRSFALVSLHALTGCALLGPLNPPRRLLDQAHAAVEQHDLETAYQDLARIRKDHPHSPESREAFPLAAAIFKRCYFRERYAHPDSLWVTTEPGFMLDWLDSFFVGPEFPQAEAEALFVGMHYGYFREFLAYAETHPELSRWTVRAEDDDGIIESIAAVTHDARSSTPTPSAVLRGATRAE